MKTQLYLTQQANLPTSGQHLIAHHTGSTITVYQAFKPSIADYAVTHQKFGGPDYKHGRMTWIKPGFMWMMYRAGWATKKDQERILAITITRQGWERIYSEAVISSYNATLYPRHEDWKAAIANSDVRLQWDPDHGPKGQKLERKAIQIGLRGYILKRFHDEFILDIKDMTDFVIEQRDQSVAKLIVPTEEVVTW